ncbi:EutN/CcmL family microcompartment protein [Bacillus sp. ISL-40]|uniref:EutN/CcmL family microcompartment protein n=1 Tax=unclassified Bacillus (in: firmicutes) TaxID=185979 RepID=UPI001BE8C7B7|nr:MULTISPECIES: EutN/CcmL family microcompartment protein [unclassified Bacillus (in: firmicutes)]MBT2698536.1 EutN/CcmL family microcompartment protein [Bacillus sp. ISL-40]MBT2720169.1 EutN/CcmL family microcompartment protein [Bacillus sp. ISL-46]MBT2728640.1 EutN/CcmL family microcompartment protein [Bacillus sp. ISL-75]MBT2739238.1 EutN/CcmL family microcompartment protein [Bacillus sp. ISL-77]MBV7504946.1 EutN/CcmL family microcompartment protein [Bacillus sp. sid0103]
MLVGTVIGNVWATRKEENLIGLKYLFVQPELPSGAPILSPFIAVDRIGAGVGDKVMVTTGSAAANIIGDHRMPIDAVIIGIIDSIDVEGGA